jgi:hypothetical protein
MVNGRRGDRSGRPDLATNHNEALVRDAAKVRPKAPQPRKG